MAIRWRELLSHLQIPWVEGHHQSRGWIGVKCPWCGSLDPSQHLGINEDAGHYRCLRAASHVGSSPYFLLHALGVAYRDMDDLVAGFGGTSRARPVARPAKPVGPYAKQWASFTAAIADPEARDYLAGRGFWNPIRTAQRYDLRTGTNRYAGRLWFPFLYGNAVAGYTGRSMRNRNPKYLTEAATSYLYMPRLPYDTDRTIILVEGPIDALRLADEMQDRYDIFVAALCGMALTPAKYLQLWSLAKLIPQLCIALDSTVPAASANRLRKELHTLSFGEGIAAERVRRLDLLPGIDDPGEMSGEDIGRWLRETGLAEMERPMV